MRRKGSPDASDVTDDEGLHLVDHTIRDAGLELLTASADTSPPSISEAYVLPQFTGMEYAYAKIDAVYVWTRGGYQVVLEPRSQIDPEMVDGRPVVPLQETVAFANEYEATFESALHMLGRMYDDVDTDAAYRMEPA